MDGVIYRSNDVIPGAVAFIADSRIAETRNNNESYANLKANLRENGIDPAEASRIFDAWARVEAEGEPARGGTGLGLAIARGFVQAHGGELTARNHPDGGAEFVIALDKIQTLDSAPLHEAESM